MKTLSDSPHETFTVKTAAIPREQRYRFIVAIFRDRPDLATAFCSKACAIAFYDDGPDGFLVQTRTLPGYLAISCPCCDNPIKE